MAIDISGKQVGIRYIEGPVGVHSRKFSPLGSGRYHLDSVTLFQGGLAAAASVVAIAGVPGDGAAVGV